MKKNVGVNSEGRIVIPAHIRKELGIKDGDEVEVELDGNYIRITTKESKCNLCNANENLNDVEGMVICDTCLEKIKHNFHLIEEEFTHEQ